MAEPSDKDLLDVLGVDVQPEKKSVHTAREERIIAGFEDIQAFTAQHSRAPEHGEDRDIFERMYAVRLDQIRRQPECLDILADLDHQGLLKGAATEIAADAAAEELSDEELLAELGVTSADKDDITKLKHVKPRAEVRAAKEVANRARCEDFDKFEPLFADVQAGLDSGAYVTKSYSDNDGVKEGEFFILSGHKLYVAEKGAEERAYHGRIDTRLRVIYDNGTESDLLMRSLQRALYKYDHGRRIVESGGGPLLSSAAENSA